MEDIFCFPGATIQSLHQNIITTFGDIIDHTINFVLVHVGTNNLAKSFWSKDIKAYFSLYNCLKERFRSCNIVFSSILPRWDSEELDNLSVVYNYDLEQFCLKNNNCYYFENNAHFTCDDSLYSRDGLHLNKEGAKVLSDHLEDFVFRLVAGSFKPKQKNRIPVELQRLWTPRKVKKQCNPWKTNLDIYKYQHKKEKKSAPRQRKSEKWRPKKDILFPDGFRLPRCTCKAEEPPQLPPNRYIPEYRTAVLIPYKDIHEGRGKVPTQSQSLVKLPGARSPYVRRKVKRKARRPTHKRRKKKVCLIHYFA